MKQIFITDEPRGDLYRALLRHTVGTCDGLLLIEHDQGLSEAGEALLERLKPYFAGRGRTSGWPGHTMPRGAATALYYAWNDEVCEIVCAAAEGLFDWQHPQLPEGLFLQKKETPWLVTHHRDGSAYIDASEEDLEALTEALPELKTRLE